MLFIKQYMILSITLEDNHEYGQGKENWMYIVMRLLHAHKRYVKPKFIFDGNAFCLKFKISLQAGLLTYSIHFIDIQNSIWHTQRCV